MLPLFVAAIGISAPPAEKPFFNGQDLAGWHNVNCAPNTFVVKDGEIVTNGRPTGYLRTDKQYENFTLEFEWMHTRKNGVANSGMFVWGDALPAVGTGYTRSIEVQVLCGFEANYMKQFAGKDPATIKPSWATDNGDLFSIWGAKCKPDRPHPDGIERCLPSERRSKGAGEWNHYKVIGNNGTLKLHFNGKEVSGVSECTPRKGYLALESEGSECRFRNFKMTEMPSTNPKPDEIASVATGFESLFDGLTLNGWTAEKGAWKPGDGTLRVAKVATLSKTLPKGTITFDYKLPAKAAGQATANGKVLDGKGWTRLQMPVDGEFSIAPVVGLEVRNLFAK